MTGTTPYSVSRLLSSWEERGCGMRGSRRATELSVIDEDQDRSALLLDDREQSARCRFGA
jgi:hypothetical protein